MSGWKEWEFLERVTSSEFQSYLQDQVVQVYGSSTARSSALGTAVSEGMISYLEDTNALQYYDGASWVNVSNPGDITGVTAGTGLTGGGDSGAVTLNVNYAAVGSAVLASPTVTGTAVLPSTTSIGSVSSTEIGFLDGVTSAIQTQLNGKVNTVSAQIQGGVTFTGTGSHFIEIGRTDGTASTPYIDFHSGATGTDFDSRVIASGGNGVAGNGALAIQAAQVNLNGTLKGFLAEEIGNAADLNTYDSSGIYNQDSNAEAAAGSNYPVGEAGLLTVSKGVNTNFVYQTYQALSAGNNRIYWRGRYNGTWSAWRQLRDITLSTTTPSGGVDGDIWLQYTP